MSSPWPLLADALGRSVRTRITHAELDEHGLTADALVAAGLLDRLSIERTWSAPDCSENCMPGFDFESRFDEGLVGYWCPCGIACTAGKEWRRMRDMESFACPAPRVAEAFRAHLHLPVLDARGVTAGIVPIGKLEKRGLVVPIVVFTGIAFYLHEVCRGLRAQLGGDGLIVLIGRPPVATSFAPTERIVLAPMRADAAGDIGLGRALDAIDPIWEERRLTDRNAIFDDVRIRFSTEAGKRHVVTVDGHELAGFQKSDLKFLRLLRLAVAMRCDGAGDGWVAKYALDGGDHDRDLIELRAELRKGDHPTLSEAERGALLKGNDGLDGRVRLAIEARHIAIDLAEFRLLTEDIEVRKGSSATVKKRATEVNVGVATARNLWRAIERRLKQADAAREGGTLK